MRKITLIILSAVLVLQAVPVCASETVKKYMSDAAKVGEGRMTFLFWDVYDATLYAPRGEISDSDPIALELSYLLDLKGQKIAESSIDEMRKIGVDDEDALSRWMDQMSSIFPDVEKQTRLTGIYTPDGETVFYKNDQEIGRIADPKFGQYFFDIWLNENTSAPDLRAQLLGNNTQ